MRGLVARTRSRVPNDFDDEEGRPITRPPSAASTEWRFVVDHGEIMRPDETAGDSQVWTVRRGENGQVRSHIRVRRPSGEDVGQLVAAGSRSNATPAGSDPWDSHGEPAQSEESPTLEPQQSEAWEICGLPATFQVDDEFDLVLQNATPKSKSR